MNHKKPTPCREELLRKNVLTATTAFHNALEGLEEEKRKELERLHANVVVATMELCDEQASRRLPIGDTYYTHIKIYPATIAHDSVLQKLFTHSFGKWWNKIMFGFYRLVSRDKTMVVWSPELHQILDRSINVKCHRETGGFVATWNNLDDSQ